MQLAPIVLFVYNRPRHTEQTLKALAANDLANESVLYIFADGPKDDASPENLQKIADTRNIVKKTPWCNKVYITERTENYGLQRSVIEGVTGIVNRYGKVIVLEDDIVTSTYFLTYMNDALTTYQDEQKVISIGAFNFFATDNTVPDTFFIPIPDCWGWATWKDRWELFEPNAQLLLNRLREKGLVKKFNLNGAFDFESMLIDQIQGNISSWAIRWQAVAYLHDKLTLYPRYSVTKNIGFGDGGTHGGDDRYSATIKFAKQKIPVNKIPIKEDASIIKKMERGYWSTTQPERKSKIKLSIRGYIKHLAPPALALLYRKIRPHYNKSIVWQGNYPTWNDAKQNCSGYEDISILEKTRKAVLKVKKGEAAGERDSVLFDKTPYSWPVIAFLLKAAIENKLRLNVVDFGGALGSSYFQSISMIPSDTELSWNVVEQAEYVKAGNEEIKDSRLSFYYSIEDALEKIPAHILLLSSVLQYLEDPAEFVDKILSYGFKYIIIDRTAFIDDPKARLTIQHIPKSIYDASYPAWFFNEDKFIAAFKTKYDMLVDFDSFIEPPGLTDDGINLYWKGFLFKLKDA